ncbi:MAG: hypothetical protein MR600_02095 [Subdoligranulum sp.]|nr:hypothetical protein [Subdoligranulum sp.]
MKKLTQKIVCLGTCAALTAGCCLPAFADSDGPVTKDENVFLFLNPDGSIQQQLVSDWLHSDTGLQDVTDCTSLTGITNLKSDAAYTLDGSALRWDTGEHDVYYQGESSLTPPVTAEILYELNGQPITAEELLGKSGHVRITVDLTNHIYTHQMIGGVQRKIYTPFATVVSFALDADDFTNLKAEHGSIQTDSQTQIAAFVALPGLQESFQGLLTGDLSDLGDKLLDRVSIEADTDCFVFPTIIMAASTSTEELLEKDEDFPSLDEALNEMRDGFDELKDGSIELDDGAHELDDGAHELDDGAHELDDGAKELDDGAKDLDDGAQKLKDGAFDLDDGAGKLKDGAAALNGGLTVLNGKLAALPDSLKAADALQASLNTQMGDLFGKMNAIPETEVLRAGFAGVQSALTSALTDETDEAGNTSPSVQTIAYAAVLQTADSTAQTMVDALAEDVAQKTAKETVGAVSDAYKAALEQAIDSDPQLSEEGKTALKNFVNTVSPDLEKIQNDATQDAAASAKEKMQGIYNTEAFQSSVQASAREVAEQVVGKVLPVKGALESMSGLAALDTTQLKADATQLQGTATQLLTLMNSMTGTLYNENDDPANPQTVYGAVRMLTAGSDELAAGTADLKGGTEKLKDGTKELKDGTQELRDGTKELRDGTQELVDGTADLVDGTQKLVDGTRDLVDGTQELLDGVDEFRDKLEEKAADVDTRQIDDALDTLDAVQAQAKTYTSYTGTPDGVDATIKFVMKVEAPEVPETEAMEPTAAVQTEKPSFWQRLKALFGWS